MVCFHKFLSKTLPKFTHPVKYFYSDNTGKFTMEKTDSVMVCVLLNSWDKNPIDLFASEVRDQNTQVRKHPGVG